MKYRFVNADSFISQAELGKHLGMEQNSISGIVARLVEKSFLHVEKRPSIENPKMEACYYTLLR